VWEVEEMARVLHELREAVRKMPGTSLFLMSLSSGPEGRGRAA